LVEAFNNRSSIHFFTTLPICAFFYTYSTRESHSSLSHKHSTTDHREPLLSDLHSRRGEPAACDLLVLHPVACDLILHQAARDSTSTRRRDLDLHPMKCNSRFTRRRWQRWREEPWWAQRHDDARMAATTTQRRTTTLLPLDDDGSKATSRGAVALLLLEGDSLKA
jgi:hypothetical protein